MSCNVNVSMCISVCTTKNACKGIIISPHLLLPLISIFFYYIVIYIKASEALYWYHDATSMSCGQTDIRIVIFSIHNNQHLCHSLHVVKASDVMRWNRDKVTDRGGCHENNCKVQGYIPYWTISLWQVERE